MSKLNQKNLASDIAEQRKKHYNAPESEVLEHTYAETVDFENPHTISEPDFNFCRTNEEFIFDSEKDMVDIWGSGKRIPNFFSCEHLPMIFARGIVFEAFNSDEGFFEWVFTGPNGGVTITVSKNLIILYQRYYDSYGFYKVDENTVTAARHHEIDWFSHVTAYIGELKTLTVSTVMH